MKIKMNVEFDSFSDGICDIYTEDEDGNKVYKHTGLGFSKRTLGYNRVFAASAVNKHVNAVIRIPQLKNIDIYDVVEIKGDGKYEIELTQDKLDTNPLSTELTLKNI